jgi:hypothetical protein
MSEITPDFRVDFTDVEPAKFDPLPAGDYVAKVTDVEFREAGENSKTPGATYLHWEFTVQEGEHATRKFWDDSRFGAGSMPFTLAFLLHTGRFTEPVTATIREIANTVVGADVKVRLKINKDGYNAVQRWLDDDSAPATNSLVP